MKYFKKRDEVIEQEDFDQYQADRQNFKEAEQRDSDDYCDCGQPFDGSGHCKYCG